jgi:hypothetical protein
MKIGKLTSLSFFLLFTTIADGQSITSHDLVGNWLFGKDKNPIEAEFKEDSEFIFYDSINIDGGYSIAKMDSEFVLILNINTGQYAWKEEIYIIRKLDNGDFKLQILKRNKNGEIIYKWQNYSKQNIFYILSRVKINKPKEPVH